MNQKFREALLRMAQNETIPRQIAQTPEGLGFIVKDDEASKMTGQDQMIMIPISELFVLINILQGQLLNALSPTLLASPTEIAEIVHLP
jgi:hypothetical protein